MPAQYELFDRYTGPADSDYNNLSTSSTGAYTLGVRFHVIRPAQLLAIRYNVDTGNGPATGAGLWDSTGATLATYSDVTFASDNADWTRFDLPSVVDLEPGTDYRAGINQDTGTYYTAESGWWTSTITTGPIVGVGGCYAESNHSPVYPSSTPAQASYWVGVVVRDKVVASGPADGTQATVATASYTARLDPAFYTALNAATRRPLVSLMADWQRDGSFSGAYADLTPYIADVEVERDITSSLPSEVTLVSGYTAAQLSATLTGRRQLDPEGRRYVLALSNLLNNGSFEQGLSPWSALNSSGSVATRSGGVTGTQYLRLSGTTSDPLPGLNYDARAAVTPGVTYRLSAYARASSGFGMDMQGDWLDSSRNYLTYFSYYYYLSGAEWQLAETELTAPDGAAYFQPYFKGDPMGSGDTLDFDGVYLGQPPNFDLDIAQILSPWRNDSPLAGVSLPGVPVRCSMGLVTADGPVLLRQFTGRVRSVKASSADRTVTLQALDPSTALHAPVTLPTLSATYAYRLLYGHGKLWTNTQWIIDYCLRQNGVSASPLARDDALLSVTGHGGYAPEVGFARPAVGLVPSDEGITMGDYFYNEHYYRTDGPFGLLAAAGTYGNRADHNVYLEYYCRYSHAPFSTGLGVSAWVYTSNPPVGHKSGDPSVTQMFTVLPTGDATPRLDVELHDNGRIGVGFVTESGTHHGVYADHSPPEQPGWRYVAAALTAYGGANYDETHLVTNVDNVVYDYTYSGVSVAELDAVRSAVQVNVWCTAPWCDLQLWHSNYPVDTVPWDGSVAPTPAARLDVGYNWMAYVPATDNDDAWEIIQKAAQAEYGRVGFDGDGVFEFVARDLTPADRMPVEMITADRSLAELNAGVTIDSARNTVSVTTQDGYYGEYQTIYQAKDIHQFHTAGNATEYYEIDLDALTTGPYEESFASSSGSWDESVIQGYQAVLTTNSDHALGLGVLISYTQTGPRTGRIKIVNGHSDPIRLQTPDSSQNAQDGQPALRIGGRTVETFPEYLQTASDADSIATYGKQSLKLDKTDYRQNSAYLGDIAASLLDELKAPSATVDDITVTGNPERQVGDVVRLQDPDGVATSIVCEIVKITRSVGSDQGLVETLAIRPLQVGGSGG